MIELRWLCATVDDPAPVLQWRELHIYATYKQWSKWQNVPRVMREGEGT